MRPLTLADVLLAVIAVCAVILTIHFTQVPRTARTDPYEPDCAVKGCRNVVYKHDFCRPHYAELADAAGYIVMAAAVMTYAHKLGRKRTAELRRKARAKGWKLLPPSEQMLTAPGRAAHAERLSRARV